MKGHLTALKLPLLVALFSKPTVTHLFGAVEEVVRDRGLGGGEGGREGWLFSGFWKDRAEGGQRHIRG